MKRFRLYPILLLFVCSVAPATSARACEGSQNVRLRSPVEFTTRQLAQFQAMPPLRVEAVNAPPMARYDPARQAYTGIAIDVFCFIASQLGLRSIIVPGRDQTVADKIRRVQEAEADIFIPLSHSDERAQRGVFSLPYYETHYAVIARKGQGLPIHTLADLAAYRVGVVKGVVLEPILKTVVPEAQLRTFDLTSSDGLFNAVQDGLVDVVVFNKNIFIEKRYEQEYFDLEIIHTLLEHARAYRFYFSPTAQHEALVHAFDRYLAVLDVSQSIAIHESGERDFLERYVSQRRWQRVLQVAAGAAALLAFLFFMVLRRYRRLTQHLAQSNQQILEQQRALQAANLSLEKQSRTDGLTGLANRRRFDQALAREHARCQRNGAPLSLLIIDADHFKQVNDHYGHAAGDDYLRAIAAVLRTQAARPADLVARYGGEEFACLLPDTGRAQAVVVAERIRNAVADLRLPSAQASPPWMTVSIGVATMTRPGISARELLMQADAQLYAAKRAGRDCTRAAVADVA